MLRSLVGAFAVFCGGGLLGASNGQTEVSLLFDSFSPGWRAKWREQSLFTRPTRYEVVTDAGRPVLRAISQSANAGLIREVTRSAPDEVRLRWHWKVKAALAANTRERERAGDDYAARVFVVFETSLNPLRTRAINYVWAAHEIPGAVFASPYTKNVAIIVLRSGDAESGRWQAEQRDVRADYLAFFGEPPKTISAVAVSVDTDNTKSSAEAWFSDLVLDTRQNTKGALKP